MQEGSRWLIKAAFRCGEGGSSLDVVGGSCWAFGGKPLGVVRKEAIRRGEKSCFTQGGEED
jgi:hypothetical protein